MVMPDCSLVVTTFSIHSWPLQRTATRVTSIGALHWSWEPGEGYHAGFMPTQVIRGNPSGVRAGRGPMLIRACDSVFGFEFQTARIKTVIASDSEAIHRAAGKVRVDCFVVSLLAMTAEHTFAISRRDSPEFCR
jgi:hypothetical protein